MSQHEPTDSHTYCPSGHGPQTATPAHSHPPPRPHSFYFHTHSGPKTSPQSSCWLFVKIYPAAMAMVRTAGPTGDGLSSWPQGGVRQQTLFPVLPGSCMQGPQMASSHLQLLWSLQLQLPRLVAIVLLEQLKEPAPRPEGPSASSSQDEGPPCEPSQAALRRAELLPSHPTPKPGGTGAFSRTCLLGATGTHDLAARAVTRSSPCWESWRDGTR